MSAPEWTKAVERPHPPLFTGIMFLGHKPEVVERATNLPCGFGNLRKNRDTLLVDRAEMATCVEMFEGRVRRRGLEYYNSYASRCYRQAETAVANCAAASAGVNGERPTSRRLRDIVSVFSAETVAFAPYLLVTIAAQATLQPRVSDMLNRALSRAPNLDESALAASLIRPSRKTALQNAQDSEASIARAIVESPSVERMIRDLDPGDVLAVVDEKRPDLAAGIRSHISEYGWIPVNYFRGEPDNEARLIQRVASHVAHPHSARDAPGSAGSSDEVARHMDELLASLERDDRDLLAVVREFSYLRSYRLDVFARCHFALRHVWPWVARALQVDVNELAFLTHFEILAGLRGEFIGNIKSIIGTRSEGCDVSIDGNNLSWQRGQADGVEEVVVPDTVTGEVAFPGKVRGIARVARTPEGAAGIGKGHILVATMTTPAYGPQLTDVGGIVTDEGGLLCHAAVIARENQVPCLIGTGTATRAFKTGDLVSLDATDQYQSAKVVDWRRGVRRQSPVLWRYFSTLGHDTEFMRAAFGVDGLPTCKNVDHQTYLATDEYAQLQAALEGLVEADPDYFADVAEKCYGWSDALIQSAISASLEALGHQSLDSLGILFRRYHDATLRVIPFRYGVLILDELLTAKLRAVVEAHGVSPEIENEVIQRMLTPVRPSFEEAYERSIEQIARSVAEKGGDSAAVGSSHLLELVRSDSSLESAVEEVRHEYEWIRTSYFTGEPLTQAAVLEDIAARLGAPQAELAATDGKAETSAYETINLSEEEARLFAVARTYVHLRSYRMSLCYKADYLARPLLAKIAAALEIDYSQLIQLTGMEIIESLSTGALSEPSASVARRNDGFGLYLANGTLWVDSHGRDEAVELDAGSQDLDRQGVLVTGQTVYPGMVTGRAKIVMGKSDLDKLTPGDIIVSPMTTNDLTTAIRKNCAGIITDEGGTMSHAAIISRENQLPCIVGTGNATAMLRDNDLIELDASQGLAKILRVG